MNQIALLRTKHSQFICREVTIYSRDLQMDKVAMFYKVICIH